MDHWEHIRSLARAQRARLLAATPGEEAAQTLLKAAAHSTGIQAEPLPAGDSLLDGGEAVLDRECNIIWFNADIEPELAQFFIAHEYAHHWLHDIYAICGQFDVDALSGEVPISSATQLVEGYSPEERREREANVYAREFLLPTDLLRQWYLSDSLTIAEIAARMGVLEGMVLHQLVRLLLGPVQSDTPQAERPGSLLLDASQQEAAHVERGPLLLEAGPGTGKTRALIGRMVFLLKQGIDPSAILALTFSNKAAEEMRTRLGEIAPEAAPRIWIGTFHAFGLELLRRFGTRLGLPSRPQVLEPMDAFFVLERLLPSFHLDHYQDINEPTRYLHDLLDAISRAKDELVGPAEYLALARQMANNATNHQEQEAAEKALEVSRVYAYYQEYLEHQHLLDFGDLIFQSVILLRSFADINKSVREMYRHVLVDEYQDVNRASGLLLREIAGSGEGLWVVGDIRQAIYRFRGAAPANMHLFDKDFPGAQTRSLRRNYRSQPAIVAVFTTLASQMQATEGTAFVPWEVERSDSDGNVVRLVAEEARAEGVAIADEITRLRAVGMAYQDQAVLCRSHAALARVAPYLEAAGIPVLYLGNVFERTEVRDLLALLSLACEGDGRGLVRVARFREYQIPLGDVQALLSLARERDIPFPRALALAQDAPSLSQQGKHGLALLEQHLAGISYGTNAWGMLTSYLFVRSQYLHPLLSDTSLAAQQQQLGIFQLLQFAYDQGPKTSANSIDPKRAFLQYVRHMEIFGEDRQLRQFPAPIMHLDAVRLLTVHASKGLEFAAVYLPGLNQGTFPARRQWHPCPPPIGMLAHSEQNEHDEEEECLFFVALSRARDVLWLSHLQRIGGRNGTPSLFLMKLERALPASVNQQAHCDEEHENTASPPVNPFPDTFAAFDAEALDHYLYCPRQYYYRSVLGLRGRSMDSGSVQARHCVNDVLSWLQDERVRGHLAREEEARLHLAALWEKKGPRDHPHETMYWEQAVVLVSRAVNRVSSAVHARAPEVWEVPLAHGRVRLTPDIVEFSQAGTTSSVIVQRVCTGRLSASERDKNIYALYHHAAEHTFPTARRTIQVISLSSDRVEEISLGQKMIATRLGRYDTAMAAILRGHFPALPHDRVCPRCPYYFICPVAEED